MNQDRRHLARQRAAVDAILAERGYQRRRWAEADDLARTPEGWLSILTVYIGKTSMETPTYQKKNYSLARFRKRITQMAAICAAILEATDEEPATERESEPRPYRKIRFPQQP